MENGIYSYSYSYGTTPTNVILKALGNQHYTMSLVGDEKTIVTQCVNQGIDAHLEAFTESTFTDTGYRLECKLSPKDMLVLLRRLEEHGQDEAMNLRSDILSTLEIEEV